MGNLKIGIFGSRGRMGRDIYLRARDTKNLEVTYLCENSKHPSIGKKISNLIVSRNISELVSQSDVIIDFTNAKGTLFLLNSITNSKKKPALVTGTTGFSALQEKQFSNFLGDMRVLRSFNMSLGVNLMKQIVKMCARNLNDLADIEIVEFHHNKKKDIPSGTALTLGHSIREGSEKVKGFEFRKMNNNKVRSKNKIGFSSVRGGNVIGKHSVYFFLDGETIELTHTASDRKVFSEGALRAAKWIVKQKSGLYSTLDMLRL